MSLVPLTRLTRVKLLLKFFVVEAADADNIVVTAITDVSATATDFRKLNIALSVLEYAFTTKHCSKLHSLHCRDLLARCNSPIGLKFTRMAYPIWGISLFFSPVRAPIRPCVAGTAFLPKGRVGLR